MEKTYKQNCRCSNCYHTWVADFNFGDSVPSVLECPYCGCYCGYTNGKPDEYNYKPTTGN